MKKLLTCLLAVCLLVLFVAPAVASVDITTTRIVYTGTGITGPYSVPWRFDLDTDLLVIKADATTLDIETILSLNVDYTVTGAGVESGGSVTLTTALTSSYKLIIMRSMNFLQATKFEETGPFTSTMVNNALDKLGQELQQVKDSSDRSIQLPKAIGSGYDVYLPKPLPYYLLGWDGSGKIITHYAPSGTIPTVTTGEIVFVPETYGGVGDGVTDDSAAVVMAVTSACVDGGTVYMSCKDWRFNLEIPASCSGITIKGCGRGGESNSITHPTGGHPWTPADTSKPIIKIGDAQQTTYKSRGYLVEDFYMDGFSDNGTGGIWLANVSDTVVRNFTIQGFTQYGLKAGDADATCLMDMDQVSVSNFGIWLGNQQGTTATYGLWTIYCGPACQGLYSMSVSDFHIWGNSGEGGTTDYKYLAYNQGASINFGNGYMGTSDNMTAYVFDGWVSGGSPPPTYFNNVHFESSKNGSYANIKTISNRYDSHNPVRYMLGNWWALGGYKRLDGTLYDFYSSGGTTGRLEKHYFSRPRIDGPHVYNKITFSGDTDDQSDNGSSHDPYRYIWQNPASGYIEIVNSLQSINLIPNYTSGGTTYASGYAVNIYNLNSPVRSVFSQAADSVDDEAVLITTQKDKIGLQATTSSGDHNAIAIKATCSSRYFCSHFINDNDTDSAAALVASGNAGNGVQTSSTTGFALQATGRGKWSELPIHSDNATAHAGGLEAGELYITDTGVLMVTR